MTKKAKIITISIVLSLLALIAILFGAVFCLYRQDVVFVGVIQLGPLFCVALLLRKTKRPFIRTLCCSTQYTANTPAPSKISARIRNISPTNTSFKIGKSAGWHITSSKESGYISRTNFWVHSRWKQSGPPFLHFPLEMILIFPLNPWIIVAERIFLLYALNRNKPRRIYVHIHKLLLERLKKRLH